MKNLVHAEKRAENHFRQAIEVAREIGAKNILAQANLGMGLLSLEMNEISKAEGYLTEAVDLFRWCEAEIYLKQAESALASCQKIIQPGRIIPPEGLKPGGYFPQK